ncbi:MAG TPA: extracellular solute-binding protein [Acidimicrobiales bacterium]|nr:extracellular solute-binding protein [Acidimicrobiales bacterium]
MHREATSRKDRNRTRSVGKGVACTTLAAAAAFVGLGPTAASASPSVVTLYFWNTYNTTDKEFSTMQNVVLKKFNEENPGLKAVAVDFPYAQLEQKFIAAAAAGDPPALLRSDIAWVPSFAAEGLLYNLTKQSWAQPILKAALPGPLSTNYYQGGYYGIPDDTNTQVLFWNKADFAAANIAGPPTTLSQLWADAATLTDKSKGQFGLGIDGTDIWNVAPYIWSDGGSFTNAALTTATGYMNGTATEAAVQQLVNLDTAGDVGSDFVGGSGAISGETGFPKGEYAMYIDGPWAVPTYRQEHFSGWSTALFPTGPGGSISTVGGEDLVIARDAPHLQDTIKLAEFLASPFAQLQMANQGDLAGYSTDSAAEVAAQPYLNLFVQQLKTARARPVAPGYSELDADFQAELQEVLAGKLSVSDAMNTAAQEANAALAAGA